MRTLCDYGADLNSKQAEGATAVYLAASIGELKILKYLQQNGANISIAERNGWTPIMIGMRLL